MSKLESIKMTIPVEMDGEVNDEEAFRRQQQINEARLRQEIKDSYKGDQNDSSYDGLMSDYEDFEYVPNPYSKLEEMSDEDRAKIAKKMRVLLARLKAEEVFRDVA